MSDLRLRTTKTAKDKGGEGVNSVEDKTAKEKGGEGVTRAVLQ